MTSSIYMLRLNTNKEFLLLVDIIIALLNQPNSQSCIKTNYKSCNWKDMYCGWKANKMSGDTNTLTTDEHTHTYR